MIGLLITVGILFVFGMISFSRITIRLHYERHQDDDQLNCTIKALFGLIRITYRVPSITFKSLQEGIQFQTEQKKQMTPLSKQKSDHDRNITMESITETFQWAKQILQHTFALKHWVRKTLKATTCSEMRWFTSIGVGDAPHTAIATGIVWGLKSQITGLLFRYVQFQKEPTLRITPSYTQKQFVTDLMVTCHMRMGKFVLAICSLLWKAIKVRGGVRVWLQVIQRMRRQSRTA